MKIKIYLDKEKTNAIYDMELADYLLITAKKRAKAQRTKK